MNFNIALSTIVYLMIFIFPGILFRKFYFRGEFTKQFHQGNLMERFVWTIFFSVICLIASFFFFYFFRYILDFKLLPSISYDSIKDLFSLLNANELPDKKTFKSVYFDFSVLIASVYFLSSLFGLFSHSIIMEFNLDIKFNVFRFRNYWYYLIKGKTEENQSKKHLFTMADVLVSDGSSENILYRGRIHDYSVDNLSNELESIILKDTIRYKRNILENGQTEIIEKNIPGNLFCIQKDRILNINISHIVRDKNYDKIKQNFWLILNIIASIIFIFLISIFFIEIPDKYGVFSFWRKTVFILFTFSIILNIGTGLKKILFKSNKSKETWSYLLKSLILNALPLLWVFWLLRGWIVFVLYSIYIIFYVLYEINKEKKDTNN